jgi:hypothetical protein
MGTVRTSETGRSASTRLYGAVSQRAVIFIVTAVRTRNLTYFQPLTVSCLHIKHTWPNLHMRWLHKSRSSKIHNYFYFHKKVLHVCWCWIINFYHHMFQGTWTGDLRWTTLQRLPQGIGRSWEGEDWGPWETHARGSIAVSSTNLGLSNNKLHFGMIVQTLTLTGARNSEMTLL